MATLLSQMLGSDGALGIDGLTIETDKVIDAQIVDIGIVGRALIREILAKIESIGSYNLSKLKKGQVMLQVDLPPKRK